MHEISNYNISDEVLGKGGMGIVYKARRNFPGLDTQTAVACKVIRAELAGDAEYEKLFVREAFTAMKLAHPNLVRVHDCYKVDGKLYLFMEYIDGMSLEELITCHGPLPDPMVAHIIGSVARALSYLHGEDICHRDVSPANVLISRDGCVKLSDLGLARTTDDEYSRHGFKGRVAFACPARLLAGKHSFHSDLWALLVTAYHAASGYLPFGPDDPTMPGRDQLDEVVRRMTAKEFAVPAVPFSTFLADMFNDFRFESACDRRFQRAGDLVAYVNNAFPATPRLAELGRLVVTSAQGEPAWAPLPPRRHCALPNTEPYESGPGTAGATARKPAGKAGKLLKFIMLAILFLVALSRVDTGPDPGQTAVQPRQDPGVEATSQVDGVCYPADPAGAEAFAEARAEAPEKGSEREPETEPRVRARKKTPRKPPGQQARKDRRPKHRVFAKEKKAKKSVVIRREKTILIPSKGDKP